jgi:hypothetical protein
MKEPTETTDHLNATFVIKSSTAKNQCKNTSGVSMGLYILSQDHHTRLQQHHQGLISLPYLRQY